MCGNQHVAATRLPSVMLSELCRCTPPYWFAHFRDPDRNVIGLLEAAPEHR